MIILKRLIILLRRPSKIFFLTALILAGSSLPEFLLVKAQEISGVKIQPAIIEQRIDPGQTFNSKIKVTNISSESRIFYVIKRDIRTLSEQGSPIFAVEGEPTGFEISSWIKITDKSINLGAGQTKEIPFAIVVPPNAPPGGHFGGIFVALAPKRPETTGIGIGYQVGTIINFRVSGEIIEEAQLRGFFADKLIYIRPKVNFSAKIENLGNVLVRPHGILEIIDPLGRQEAALNVNEETSAVFPKTIREFKFPWESDKLLFGNYKAILSLTYGEEGRQSLSDTVAFWIVPLNIILPVFGALMAMIIGIILFIRFQVRKRVRQIIKNTDGISVNRNQKSSALLPAFALITLLILILLLLTLLFLLFA